MVINQRDVYSLPHPINSTSQSQHPFIVLSTIDSNSIEKTFIAVMITSSEITKDDYSFELRDDMFVKPLKKKDCHVRMHLVTLMLNEDTDVNHGIKVNEMKEFYFKELMASIGDLIFNYDFKPNK